jgi:hypothetical protein
MLAVVAALAVVIGLALLWMREQPEDELNPEPADTTQVLPPAQAIDRAQQLVAAGNYRAAVRYLFLALLAVLDDKKLLRYDRTLTNRELLRLAGQNPTLAGPLEAIVHTFDAVWYGFEPIVPSDYDLLLSKIDLLKRL